MTTKTITIQKKEMVVLPKKWLQKINQADKIKACFVNGNIILSSLGNEQVCALFDQDLNKKIIKIRKKKYNQLDRELDKAIQEVSQGKCVGPFNSVEKLKKSLEKYED